jgi:hypothetical protein
MTMGKMPLAARLLKGFNDWAAKKLAAVESARAQAREKARCPNCRAPGQLRKVGPDWWCPACEQHWSDEEVS